MPMATKGSAEAASTPARKTRTASANSKEHDAPKETSPSRRAPGAKSSGRKARTKLVVEVLVSTNKDHASEEIVENTTRDMKKEGDTVGKTPGRRTVANSILTPSKQILGEEATKQKAARKEELRSRLLKAEAELRELKAKLPAKANSVPIGPRGYEKKPKPESFPTPVQKKSEQKDAKQKESAERKPTRHTRAPRSIWRTSPALGGRFLPIEPVFSRDEKYIFLAHERSVLVYSLKTSMLVRSLIPVGASEMQTGDRIVGYAVDPMNVQYLYFATSTGNIYLFDWTEGTMLHVWNTKQIIEVMEVCAETEGLKKTTKAYFVCKNIIKSAESGTRRMNKWELKHLKLHYEEGVAISEISEEQIQFIQSFGNAVSSLKVAPTGAIITAITANMLWIGMKLISNHEDAWDNWRHFTFSSELTSMDLMILDHGESETKGKKQRKSSVKGFLVLGDKNGKIYLWHDIFREDSDGQSPGDMRAFHWHRGAVESVKLSKDGNYIISGGSETVLVLWQLDTGHKQFLPHLTSAIEHVVVSPSGSSYAIRLADNSIMVLSTTELKPKANIAGIQALPSPIGPRSATAKTPLTIDSLESTAKRDFRVKRVVCSLHPILTDSLLLAAPSYHSAHLSTDSRFAACPYIQTYDTFTDKAISRQALARTLATQVKIGPMGNILAEPDVKLLAISGNGEWLASLDEWESPTKNFDGCHGEGREVFLKFWKKNQNPLTGEKDVWELITRVDSPHPSPVTAGLNGGLEVFEIVPLPGKLSTGFATVGADGCVRIWKPRIRMRAGASVKKEFINSNTDGKEQFEELVNWGCKRVIQFSKELSANSVLLFGGNNGIDGASEVSWSSMTISSDRSVIAVAAPASSTATDIHQDFSLIYIIDPLSSSTKQVLSGLQTGPVAALTFINQYLVIAGTAKLVVWDLVKGEVKWEFPVEELLVETNCKPTKRKARNPNPHDPKKILQTRKDIYLASSLNTDGSFAIGINMYYVHNTSSKPNIVSTSSKIFLFTPTSPIPLHVTRLQPFECLSALKAIPTTADKSPDPLIAVPERRGYLYLTSNSHIRYLTPLTTQHVSVTSTPLIGETGVTSSAALSRLYAPDTIADSEVEHMDVDVSLEEESEEEQAGEVVVPFQVLSDIFENEGPAYAMGGVGLEGVFEKVLGIFTGGGNENTTRNESNALAKRSEESAEEEELE